MTLTLCATQFNKDAMSRALGAAFLSHQVKELEKTVSDGTKPRDRRGSRGGGPRPPRNVRPAPGRRSGDREHSSEREDRYPGKKDASVIVVDASVLVHALGQLKAWCGSNREEVIIVPLEALNTLDLLKKGTSTLAQRARAASRILEQQVGTNPRIKVQPDVAYVLWDKIPFAKDEQANNDAGTDAKIPGPPEWLRRTICCARWEFDHGAADVVPEGADRSPPSPLSVAVAVCLESAQLPDAPVHVASTSPVPLPAPQPSKYEQRCAGGLVAQWAKEAGIPVLDYKATPLPPPPSARHVRTPSDEEWRTGPPKTATTHAPRQKFASLRIKGPSSPVNEKTKTNVYGPGRGGGAMVERPAATMAMNASMMQLSKPIRVLARGEKLEP
ncbi:hypothetical protein DFH11DRAFT_1511060 [Phellopilus nigrolimitatus]|nr:hypothetical protein DFH11DRAFT_1511060 [Phellopilus nigrolimitatus]